MTRFAAMARSDHSMRPPMPAATIAFKSPNACNICHTDHDAAWSDDWVRKWYAKDYQAETLRIAGLIDAARKNEWKRLPELLAYLTKTEGDAVFKASLVRLLRGCDDESKWPVLTGLLKDHWPLVRASAASALGDHLTPDVVRALGEATADGSRLVRIRSAMSLAAVPPGVLADRQNLDRAVDEFKTAMRARPDDWASYANLGNFYMEGSDFAAAVRQFAIAYKLEPRAIGPIVNAAIAYSTLKQNKEAEDCLRHALKVEPANAAANFNLGLLLGEEERYEEAEQAHRAALKSDPQMAAAAYNLGVILAKKDVGEAVLWCQKALAMRPSDPKYAHTLAFFQRQKGDLEGAVDTLRKAIRRNPSFVDAYLLLGQIYEETRDLKAAEALYREALGKEGLSQEERAVLTVKLRGLSGPRQPGPEP
jgi:tetratricopeptide (TPR) repeat protein